MTTLWYFIGALVIGGAERTLVDLVNDLDHDEYDVTIWTIFSTNPLESELDTAVTVRSLTDAGQFENGTIGGVETPLAYVIAPLRFCVAAWREDPDVIQSFLFYGNVIVRIAGLLCSAKVITGIRSVPDSEPLVRRLIDKVTLPLSDAIVSNSTAGREFAIERGAKPDDVAVVYNGRNVDTYRSATPATLHEELDIPADATVVGTVGRLLERKGHFDLLEAWATVEDELPDAHLVFVGDGRDRQDLEQRIEDLDCTDSVHLLGTRDDVPSLLNAMDVFVFPSHFEGLPGAVIEAMAAGLPIVATPVDGNSDLLENYRSGLFVDVRSPKQIAWATIRLANHPDFAAELGTTASARAAEQFTVAAMVDGFETVYRRVSVTPKEETVYVGEHAG
ncbi:glycosyltransferase [Haloarcula sp. 1CSR25-25]|uniref:glycosyltransferase n=1 Tax=Haloarcula sp. 1CSR25-25 TaxID=2862545 RepID=UPI00289384DB|nr:glycosyltransferase [Haloarcula sp. 1CSR25-25]MDT3435764.1 glycosyltransferase [Haloarcula sp. 1CSR25-25]